jgi:GH24 family phage-related lysozyme (muramidase)
VAALTILLAALAGPAFSQGPEYPLIVAGSPDLDASYSNGSLVVRFQKSAKAAGQPATPPSTLPPGQGAWVDRPVNGQEPATIIQSLTEPQAENAINWLHRGGIVTFYCRNTSKGYFQASHAERVKFSINPSGGDVHHPETKFPTRADRLPSQELLFNIDEVQKKGAMVMALRRNPHLPPICPEGIKLTEESEGWDEFLYEDSARYCTIGYGHLLKRAPCDGTGDEVRYLNGIQQTPEGESLLQGDLQSAHTTVATQVTLKLTDRQVAAITDFVFNVGSGNFQRSTLLVVLNKGEFSRVRPELKRWVNAGGKPWPGLVKRRERETALFYTDVRTTEAFHLPSTRQPEQNLPPVDIEAGEGPH